MGRLNTLFRLARYGFPSTRTETPLILLFNVTTLCNMNCLHCGDDVFGNPVDDLSLTEIEKMSLDLGELEELALGGGEPFMRKDLPEIVRLFVENNGVTTLCIPTNGFNSEQICTAIEKIIVTCPSVNLTVCMSLDGFEKTHDFIRSKPGAFAGVMDTARRFSELRSKYYKFNFFLNATMTNVNHLELPKVAEYVREKFQTHLAVSLLTGTPRDPSTIKLPSTEEIKEAMSKLYALRGSTAVETSFFRVARKVIRQSDAERRQVIPCRAASLIVAVFANGDVRACPSRSVIGNIRNESIREIWNSDEARRQHRSIIRGECGCNNDCYIGHNINHYWRLPFMMLKESVFPAKD